MIWFPPAKINLGLQVLRKRTDGFHDISTCFYPVGWTDILEIIPSDNFSFTSTGLKIAGDAGENMCIKAYQLLKKDFALPPVKIHLHKVIPMGAGLGGGSSDAAWTLRGLNTIFDLKIDSAGLESYAVRLGSDCPFFIHDTPMLAEGRGEILSPADITLDGLRLVIIYPEIHVGTAESYSRLLPREGRTRLHEILKKGPASWKGQLTNDFEDSVFQQYPEIGALKNNLYDLGAVFASMSGSGSAVFGLFDDIPLEIIAQFKSYKVYVSPS